MMAVKMYGIAGAIATGVAALLLLGFIFSRVTKAVKLSKIGLEKREVAMVNAPAVTRRTVDIR
jgi:hypothetical protein